jgi:hypothetical protein
MGWVWHVAYRGQLGNAYKIFIEKPKWIVLDHLLRVHSFLKNYNLISWSRNCEPSAQRQYSLLYSHSMPLEPIPKFNPVRAFTFCLFRIRHNIILPQANRYHKLYLPLYLLINEETASIAWMGIFSVIVTDPQEEISIKQTYTIQNINTYVVWIWFESVDWIGPRGVFLWATY